VAIYGLARLLKEKHGHVLGDKGQRHCEQILRAARDIVELVEKINMYISTREVSLRFQPIHLIQVLFILVGVTGRFLWGVSGKGTGGEACPFSGRH